MFSLEYHNIIVNLIWQIETLFNPIRIGAVLVQCEGIPQLDINGEIKELVHGLMLSLNLTFRS